MLIFLSNVFLHNRSMDFLLSFGSRISQLIAIKPGRPTLFFTNYDLRLSSYLNEETPSPVYTIHNIQDILAAIYSELLQQSSPQIQSNFRVKHTSICQQTVSKENNNKYGSNETDHDTSSSTVYSTLSCRCFTELPFTMYLCFTPTTLPAGYYTLSEIVFLGRR